MKQITFELSAKNAIHEFFDIHSIEESEETIWNLLVNGFSSDEQLWAPKYASETTFFCKNVTNLLKKLHALHLEMNEPQPAIAVANAA